MGIRGSKVLVTGAAGFIGSHLVDQLLEEGAYVTGVDDFDGWYGRAQKRSNLSGAATNGRFTLVEMELTSASAADLFESTEVVFHLAGRPSVQGSWGAGFTDACRRNIETTQAVFEAALRYEVRRVVYSSSSSVYGRTANGRSQRATAPVSPYGVTKLAGEQLADCYRLRGLETTILRYFSVYGPRQRPDMAMHRLFTATSGDGELFQRRGDGEQLREFTFVSDVVEATVSAGFEKAAAGAVIDIGGGSVSSLNRVMRLVEQVAGSYVRFESIPLPAGEPAVTKADRSLARSLLDWQPATSLRAGLEAQWAWHTQCAPPQARLPLRS